MPRGSTFIPEGNKIKGAIVADSKKSLRTQNYI